VIEFKDCIVQANSLIDYEILVDDDRSRELINQQIKVE